MSSPARPSFRESAVVVLVRGRGDALETFWVRRGDTAPVMPGLMAFPGGTVSAVDRELEIAGALDDDERTRRACAVREAFEETGALVGLASPVPTEGLEDARRRLLAGEIAFPALALERGWRFRADALVAAGRWQTPPFSAARFDAVYYLARVADDTRLAVQSSELAAGEWIRPEAALARWRAGEATFAAPVLWTLRALAAGEERLAERLAAGPERARDPVQRIELKWGIVLHPMKTRPLPPATHTSAYLVGEHELALVDPGSGEPAELERLFMLIDMLARESRRLTIILVTHAHADHVGGVEAVRARYHVPVAAHAEAAAAVRADRVLADGDRVALAAGDAGAWDLRVLHTPGHARGHLCFLHERTRSLLCGDHITGGAGTVIIDPPEGDMAAYVRSLERLLGEPIETLFPAHGSPQGAAKRRIQWLIDHRREREARVIAALGPEPAALAALVERAYADTPRDLWGYAERSLLAHLLKLEGEGRAARVAGAGGAPERWRRAGA